MKFKISRTSEWDDKVKPCEGAKLERHSCFDIRTLGSHEEYDVKFGSHGTWLSKGINHCINDEGYVQRVFPDEGLGWFLEFNTLDELIGFQSKYGDIVIQTCNNNPNIIEIEIYDDYRE